MDEPKWLRQLRRCVYILTATLVIVVAFTIAWVVTKPGEQVQDGLTNLVQDNLAESVTRGVPYTVHVPTEPGERILAVDFAGGRMHVRIGRTGSESIRIVTIDAGNGRQLGTVTVGPE